MRVTNAFRAHSQERQKDQFDGIESGRKVSY